MVVEADNAMPCPFEVFSYLYHHYPDNFAARFLGSEEASVDNAATCLRSASVAYASALSVCVCMCVFRCGNDNIKVVLGFHPEQ